MPAVRLGERMVIRLIEFLDTRTIFLHYSLLTRLILTISTRFATLVDSPLPHESHPASGAQHVWPSLKSCSPELDITSLRHDKTGAFLNVSTPSGRHSHTHSTLSTQPYTSSHRASSTSTILTRPMVHPRPPDAQKRILATQAHGQTIHRHHLAHKRHIPDPSSNLDCQTLENGFSRPTHSANALGVVPIAIDRPLNPICRTPKNQIYTLPDSTFPLAATTTLGQALPGGRYFPRSPSPVKQLRPSGDTWEALRVARGNLPAGNENRPTELREEDRMRGIGVGTRAEQLGIPPEDFNEHPALG
ncbi:hypothetical protein DFP72DRAFT_1104069 [Ephemerocybe angulata]|uniref:Uncharacterized protein n=1 Tax=Ephemerocybe angulata TaxID=980116 RepID=A0A8H6I7R7_9AGAR|nr:hypothetical protein DFP72DRAFT_844691 [Tulosesus angulatus]KAF6758898.1 hypothetical protein DFP72DRAFT_1104069 [Tulosesus angulatus]